MNRLVGYRNMLSMTQSDMAKHLGISLQSYWSKENKRVPFTDKEKILIKELFSQIFEDITIDAIFFEEKVLKL